LTAPESLWHGFLMTVSTKNKQSAALPAPSPPSVPAKSPQYDLFGNFFGGNKNDQSNSIDFWDAIPKNSVSLRVQSQMRDDKGRLPVHQYAFEHHPSPKADNPTYHCLLSIQPASIELEDGSRQDFYPSADEELIEEVIKKIFSDQRYGIHDAPASKSWVRFSINMIRKELQARGKTRSDTEIKRSLEILSRAVIEVTMEGQGAKKTYTTPIISELGRVSRSDYLDDPTAMWTARLPVLVSTAINQLAFRQFNYGLSMSLSSQIARWLHKRLSHEYVNADIYTPYKILFTTIERDSGLLHHTRMTRNIETVDSALQELEKKRMLYAYKAEKRCKGRAIIDVLYELTPSLDFVKEMKAANARARDGRASLERR
jgi:hypothetical protein